MKINIENKEHWLSLRTKDITSTDCAVLFGLSPYKTIFELWHEKKSEISMNFTENNRMKWGSRLEAVIAEGIAQDKGWTVTPMKDYHRDEVNKIGSSFDYYIENENAILEIKNVDSLVYKNKWTEFEAPTHIELQVQHQMLVSGLTKAYICAFVGGNDFHVIERQANEDIHKAIVEKSKEFWKSIEDNIEPKIDFERDAEFLIALNQLVDPGTIYDGPTDQIEKLVIKYKELGQAENKIKADKTSLKAQILEIIGDKEKVKSEKFSISAGMIGEKTVSYSTKPYRDFRVFTKGEKKDV